jgi:hypothetical protein
MHKTPQPGPVFGSDTLVVTKMVPLRACQASLKLQASLGPCPAAAVAAAAMSANSACTCSFLMPAAAGLARTNRSARPCSSSQVLFAPVRCQPCRASRRRTVAARYVSQAAAHTGSSISTYTAVYTHATARYCCWQSEGCRMTDVSYNSSSCQGRCSRQRANVDVA